ncbi:5-amino-6-(5-phospho-D-ribitylamino)uracil phosphatase, chloroplastic [Cucurbita argyrosperma subsp. argyrosperma]|nr:5-amino-6-(5-phospho-D-ribitylamino)uracil phosphatase, chloroplastic [Cucurbita argyrosperma subsp. argyrosperma]
MDCTCSNFRTSTAPFSWIPTSTSKLKFRNLKRLNSIKHSMVAMSVSGSGENGSLARFPLTPNKLFMQEAIGAEYGEGFESFRPDGPMKVDVDFLNDRLQEGFLKRIRYSMKPDEAYGLVFSWDNVVADTQTLKLNAWKQLASEEGKRVPEDGDVQKLMLYAGADQVLQKLLLWGMAESELDRLKLRFSELYYRGLLSLKTPVDGLKEWLDALDRKPSKCVVFEDDPRGITAAHNCTMMAIALIGAHPAYDLVQADLAVGSFNELSVINLRRLFANKGSTFMELQKQSAEKAPSKRKLRIDTIF